MTGVSGAAASREEHSADPSAGGATEQRWAATGLGLAAVLDTTDLDGLDDHYLLEAVAGWERVAAWAAARQLDAMAELARRPARVQVAGEDVEAVRAEYALPGRWVREFADVEVGARLRIRSGAAGARVGLACDLRRLPATRAALTDGRIDLARARLFAKETASLDTATAQQVEAALIERATHLSVGGLRDPLRRAVIAADPVAAQARVERARSERSVAITPAADGMADLWAHLTAAEATVIGAVITAGARASRAAAVSGDTRTMEQRGADAFCAPFQVALRSGALPTVEGSDGVRLARHRGRGVELQVTVAASTLLGLDELPAYLAGYGPVTASVARELAVDARWRRVLTDPASGAVLDVGTTTYEPPASLARFVETRSPTCTFPSCERVAVGCDLDHTVAFPVGSTSATNLGPRCRRHHRFKHSAGVSVEQDEDGTTRWTMPTGHEFEVLPPPVGPVVEPPDRAPPF